MGIVLKLLIFSLLVLAAWFLAHRVVPFLFIRIGRAFGFRMRMTPLTLRRVNRFRRIHRGYWSFVIITTGLTLSLFLELFMNNRPLLIRYGDQVKFPAVAEWLDEWVPFVEFDVAKRAIREDFGFTGHGEVDYRRFARISDDPGYLELEAEAIEQEIVEDEFRYRESLAEAAIAKGQEPDPDEALTEDKIAQYEEMRAAAAGLRRQNRAFRETKTTIVMPLHAYSPREQLLDELESAPPHRAFSPGVPILGTDFEGKDVLSQLFYGFRVSFLFAFFVALIGYSFGVLIGAAMGYYGGWLDIGVQRFIEIWSSIPFLFTMMIIGGIYARSFLLLVVLLVLLRAWLGITYTIRGEFYREKARDYVQAARAIGVSGPKIIVKHILPNALVPVVTFMPFSIVAFIGALVSLDFLGFGLPVDVPSWGRLLRQGTDNVANYQELVYWPIICFSLTLFCVVMIGEAVREAFDPKTYSRLR